MRAVITSALPPGVRRAPSKPGLAIAAVLAAGCGGPPRPATPPPPAFDARGLAARLEAAMDEIEAATGAHAQACAAMADAVAAIEARARGPVDEARAAERDPEHARALTAALHAYDRAAAGRSDVIAMRLAICWQQHPELHDRLQQVVDAMPTP